MNFTGQLIGQDAINTTMTFDRIFACKNVRNRDYFEVRFRVWWHTVIVAFIDDLQMRGSQLLNQFFLNRRLYLHHNLFNPQFATELNTPALEPALTSSTNP